MSLICIGICISIARWYGPLFRAAPGETSARSPTVIFTYRCKGLRPRVSWNVDSVTSRGTQLWQYECHIWICDIARETGENTHRGGGRWRSEGDFCFPDTSRQHWIAPLLFITLQCLRAPQAVLDCSALRYCDHKSISNEYFSVWQSQTSVLRFLHSEVIRGTEQRYGESCLSQSKIYEWIRL